MCPSFNLSGASGTKLSSDRKAYDASLTPEQQRLHRKDVRALFFCVICMLLTIFFASLFFATEDTMDFATRLLFVSFGVLFFLLAAFLLFISAGISPRWSMEQQNLERVFPLKLPDLLKEYVFLQLTPEQVMEYYEQGELAKIIAALEAYQKFAGLFEDSLKDRLDTLRQRDISSDVRSALAAAYAAAGREEDRLAVLIDALWGEQKTLERERTISEAKNALSEATPQVSSDRYNPLDPHSPDWTPHGPDPRTFPSDEPLSATPPGFGNAPEKPADESSDIPSDEKEE